MTLNPCPRCHETEWLKGRCVSCGYRRTVADELGDIVDQPPAVDRVAVMRRALEKIASGNYCAPTCTAYLTAMAALRKVASPPPASPDVPVGDDDSLHEVNFVHGDHSGWTRIGRYDSARRRSLWIRLIGEDESGGVQAIELCSGREGDDAYVKLTSADPQWAALCDVLLRVDGDCGLKMPEEPKT